MKMWKQVACNLKRNKTGANFKEHRKPSEAFSPSVKIRHEPVCSVAEVGEVEITLWFPRPAHLRVTNIRYELRVKRQFEF